MIFHVASVAADALGEAALEPDLAVPALARSLDRPEPWMRRSAAEALGNYGEAARPARPALTKAKDDSDGGVRWEAANALRKIAPRTQETPDL